MRILCAQARHFEASESLKPSRQGQKTKGKSTLNNEAVALGVQSWLRTLQPGQLLQTHLNTTLLPSFDLVKKSLSLWQARRWLWRLGYRVYWDGHERKDMKKRRKEYLEEMEKIESNEQVLKKKEKGRLIMVSGFICQCYSNLALTESMLQENAKLPENERLMVMDLRVTICPTSATKSGDNYWNMDQMIAQLRTAIPIARCLYPNAVIHWVFNNSSCHGSLAQDALTASKMNTGMMHINVNPGGKVPDMHDTTIPATNPHGRGILHERGLLKPGMIGDCQACKDSKSRKAHITGLTDTELGRIDADEEYDTEEEEDERPSDCCMRGMLSLEDDFQNETSLLQQIIEEAGDVCHFLPKFHPELNPIEYYWGWAKNYFRERSTGNFAKAKALVMESLNNCPLLTIGQFFRRAFRYASVYRLGVTGVAAEYAVWKFKSHRTVRQKDLDVAESERKSQVADLEPIWRIF
ncbi:hypothetical protein OH76DRAFT_1457190 [Lentinus brumalis]|uniref:Tc1-like transposase DDE domain-containing protein n=1 Tax=Lentinus brumalis TaxID=2498619 RepID=A0A371D1I9_9APHY|nr:hypothetical protein OH76DRAFT_1457190 [Polyporus brumalis]